jgi:hypothetical protein
MSDLEFDRSVAYTSILVPASNPNLPEEGESQRIISPFAQTTSTVQPTRTRHSISWPLWIVSSLLVLVIVGITGYFTYKYLENPYRTLESFPVDKYMSDYRSLTGAKFKADLKVSADLGWKAETGRLMVFTVANDNQPVVVLIPPKLSGIFFTKGQSYQASLEVGEGGLIYADTCEKE